MRSHLLEQGKELLISPLYEGRRFEIENRFLARDGKLSLVSNHDDLGLDLNQESLR